MSGRVPKNRQKRDRSPVKDKIATNNEMISKKKPTPATFSDWCHEPLWLLDSWTYEVPVLKFYDLEECSFKKHGNEFWVRRTSQQETSMMLLQEGASLAAFCGDTKPEGPPHTTNATDRRDVALAVAMAKMIAFLPFRGVRAGADFAAAPTVFSPGIDIDNSHLSSPGIRRLDALLTCDHSANSAEEEGVHPSAEGSDDDGPPPPPRRQRRECGEEDDGSQQDEEDEGEEEEGDFEDEEELDEEEEGDAYEDFVSGSDDDEDDVEQDDEEMAKNKAAADSFAEHTWTMVPKDPPAAPARYNTPLKDAFNIELSFLEEAAGFLPLSTMLVLEHNLSSELFQACGAVGNIFLLHQIAKRVPPSVEFLVQYVAGAAMSDNPTSIELLLRFPPPRWGRVLSDFFRLSQAPPLQRAASHSPLSWIEQAMSVNLPESFEVLVTEEEFRGGSHIVKKKGEFSSATPNASAFHARLVALIIGQKQFPNCGRGGHMSFPPADVALFVSALTSRLVRGGSLLLGNRRYSQLDLCVYTVELLPREAWVWCDLNYALGRKGTVELDIPMSLDEEKLKAASSVATSILCAESTMSHDEMMLHFRQASSTKRKFTKPQVALRMLELDLARADQDEKDGNDPRQQHYESRGWNAVALSGGSATVDVRGVTYTMIECAQKALTICLAKGSPLSFTVCEWDTLGMLLEAPPAEWCRRSPLDLSKQQSPLFETLRRDAGSGAEERQARYAHAAASSYFTDAPRQQHAMGAVVAGSPTVPEEELPLTAYHYNNEDCLLVCLGVEPSSELYWAHLGTVCWRNSLVLRGGSAGSVAEYSVAVPWSIVEDEKVLPILTNVLASLAKDIHTVKVGGKEGGASASHSPPASTQNRCGAMGRVAPYGPCACVAQLTELECYLIALRLNEVRMLTDVATEDPPEVLQRLLDVLTLERISEKGRRVVEKLS